VTELRQRRVLMVRRHAPDLVELTVEADGADEAPTPGQFYQLHPKASLQAWLPRPMSYFRRGRGYLSFYFRIVGEGTAELARLGPGDRLRTLGPLGRGFPLDRPGPHLLLGGGVGVAPLWDLARSLAAQGEDVVVAIGGRSAAEVRVAESFQPFASVTVTTEDGSAGRPGLVTDLLEEVLAGRARRPATVYACGPLPMLRKVGSFVRDKGLEGWGIEGYLALETTMACGFGACLGCAVPRARREEGKHYLKLCSEGPVVACREVVL